MGLPYPSEHPQLAPPFECDSLFDDDESDSLRISDIPENCSIASERSPPIPGLHYDPSLLLSNESCAEIIRYIEDTYIPPERAVNQVMLFGGTSGLPIFFDLLLAEIAELLLHYLPKSVYEMLFPYSDLTPS